MRTLTRLTFLVLAVLLLAGCGGQSPATATSPASSIVIATEESTATLAVTATSTTSSTPAPPTATATASATAAAVNTATAQQPTVAEPPPGLLLALENSAGGWGLWLVDEDGELRQLLEEIAAPTYRPDFHVAPDGRQVLYAYQGDIWRLDAASGETENVTQTEERLESAPRWLPGEWEHFVAGSFPVDEFGPAVGYLTLIGFDGSYEILDEEGSMTAPPAPSPDGNTIAYSKGQPFLYHLDGPEQGSRPLTLSSFGLDWVEKAGEASWSPDGSRLAWTMLGAPETSHQATLLTLDLAAGDHQVLMTYTPAGIGGMPPAPLWGPDGGWLVASPLTFEPETSGLWLAESEGKLRRLTTQAPRLSHTPNPALAPDRRRLAYSTGAFDAVGLLTAGEWEPVFWEPPQGVGAVGWITAPDAESLVEQTAETTPAATLTPPSSTLDPAMRPGPGIVTPAAKAAEALLPYEPTGGMPAEIEAWAWYDVHYTDLVLPVPPGWTVSEWPYDNAHVFYSAAIQPPLWAEPAECGYQCPEISVAVWRLPPAESLRAWLERHGTDAPFGSEAPGENASIFFWGVGEIRETTVGGQPALAFYDEAMGIRRYNIIFEIDGAVVSLTKTHVDNFEFEPVFDFMRRQAQVGSA